MEEGSSVGDDVTLFCSIFAISQPVLRGPSFMLSFFAQLAVYVLQSKKSIGKLVFVFINSKCKSPLISSDY